MVTTLLQYMNLLSSEMLDDKVQAIQLEALASSTRKVRRSQWNNYYKFCDERGLTSIPVSPQNVSRYLVYMGCYKGLAFSTVNNNLSAINHLAKLHGTSDLREDFVIKLVVSGLKRSLGVKSNPKDPLLPQDLVAIHSKVNFSSISELAVWSGILLCFRTLLRKCHAFTSEEEPHLLRRADVSFDLHGLRIQVRSSKTDQHGARPYVIPVAVCNSVLCLVSTLRLLFARAQGAPHAPLISTGGGKPVKYAFALACLQRWCGEAGIKKDIGLHSLRRGAATFMHLCGIGLQDIRIAGDWASLAVLSYLATPLDHRQRVEALVASKLRQRP